MTIYTALMDLPSELRNQVIAIGNFDGVHLGHQALLSHAKDIANQNNKKLGVLTFEPHPTALFRPDEPPFRITPPDIKHERLFQCGVDFICALEFDWAFASQSADDFISNILEDGLNPHHIVTGYDFRFGQLRKGNAQTIKDAGLPITEFDKVETPDGEKYASSAIRHALRHGHIDRANQNLGGAPWEIRGIIQKGDQRGHDLGYPTANIPLKDIIHPAYGVYAAQVQIDGEDLWRKAAINIGIRPMFELNEGRVEAHILDFEDQDIYGKTLHIRPLKYLRGEAKFETLDALKKQIEKDCQNCRNILK